MYVQSRWSWLCVVCLRKCRSHRFFRETSSTICTPMRQYPHRSNLPDFWWKSCVFLMDANVRRTRIGVNGIAWNRTAEYGIQKLFGLRDSRWCVRPKRKKMQNQFEYLAYEIRIIRLAFVGHDLYISFCFVANMRGRISTNLNTACKVRTRWIQRTKMSPMALRAPHKHTHIHPHTKHTQTQWRWLKTFFRLLSTSFLRFAAWMRGAWIDANTMTESLREKCKNFDWIKVLHLCQRDPMWEENPNNTMYVSALTDSRHRFTSFESWSRRHDP